MSAELPRRSDCARCAALCCTAFAAEEMPGFAATKAAGEPCPNLDACNRCRIYADRAEMGFAGCIGFECFGAGQYVTGGLSGGRDWHGNKALREAMCAAFLDMRRGFELRYLVAHAVAFEGLGAAERQALAEIDADLVALIESGDHRHWAALEARLKAVYAALPAAG